MSFTLDEMNRYSQQIKLNEIGIVGQEKLKNARVLCIGAGGLGSSLLYYLAAAGIGTIGIVDHDVIELSNLQRQILYQTSHVEQKKAIIAKQQLSALNPDINIHAYTEKFTLNNARELINQYDIIADCSDNFTTRYLAHDISFSLDKPYVFASISQFSGQCSIFSGKNNPCFRCLFPVETINHHIPNCSESGVLGVLPGLLGIIQANEIIKWLLNFNDNLLGQLLTVDILKMEFRKLYLTKNPECVLCGLRQQSIPELFQAKICQSPKAISAQELQKKLNAGEKILLVDVRTMEEHQISNIGGLLIPLSELSQRLNEIDFNASIVIYCHSGPRSIAAAKILHGANFNSIRYLEGGISAILSFE